MCHISMAKKPKNQLLNTAETSFKAQTKKKNLPIRLHITHYLVECNQVKANRNAFFSALFYLSFTHSIWSLGILCLVGREEKKKLLKKWTKKKRISVYPILCPLKYFFSIFTISIIFLLQRCSCCVRGKYLSFIRWKVSLCAVAWLTDWSWCVFCIILGPAMVPSHRTKSKSSKDGLQFCTFSFSASRSLYLSVGISFAYTQIILNFVDESLAC